METKVYLFIATDERAFAHSTIEGAKSEWEKVRHNWADTHKCNWHDADENEMEVVHDTPVINAVEHA